MSSLLIDQLQDLMGQNAKLLTENQELHRLLSEAHDSVHHRALKRERARTARIEEEWDTAKRVIKAVEQYCYDRIDATQSVRTMSEEFRIRHDTELNTLKGVLAVMHREK